MVQIIIARYKEDISWISNIKNINISNIKIYNKHYNDTNYLDNKGREGHTYLTHIVDNYDCLYDYTYFLQGDPLVHDKEIIQTINELELVEPMYFFGKEHIENIYSISAPPHPNGLPIYYFFDLLFSQKLTIDQGIRFFAGANFVVNKYIIRSRPKRFYEFLLKFLSYETDPIEGYIIERLWPYIFNTNLTISDKYKLFT